MTRGKREKDDLVLIKSYISVKVTQLRAGYDLAENLDQ